MPFAAAGSVPWSTLLPVRHPVNQWLSVCDFQLDVLPADKPTSVSGCERQPLSWSLLQQGYQKQSWATPEPPDCKLSPDTWAAARVSTPTLGGSSADPIGATSHRGRSTGQNAIVAKQAPNNSSTGSSGPDGAVQMLPQTQLMEEPGADYVPTLFLGDLFLTCNTAVGLDSVMSHQDVSAPHLDPTSQLLAHMAVPVGGQRLIFVGRQSAEDVRRALVTKRYEELEQHVQKLALDEEQKQQRKQQQQQQHCAVRGDGGVESAVSPLSAGTAAPRQQGGAEARALPPPRWGPAMRALARWLSAASASSGSGADTHASTDVSVCRSALPADAASMQGHPLAGGEAHAERQPKSAGRLRHAPERAATAAPQAEATAEDVAGGPRERVSRAGAGGTGLSGPLRIQVPPSGHQALGRDDPMWPVGAAPPAARAVSGGRLQKGSGNSDGGSTTKPSSSGSGLGGSLPASSHGHSNSSAAQPMLAGVPPAFSSYVARLPAEASFRLLLHRWDSYSLVVSGTDARAVAEAKGRKAALNLHKGRPDRWVLEVLDEASAGETIRLGTDSSTQDVAAATGAAPATPGPQGSSDATPYMGTAALGAPPAAAIPDGPAGGSSHPAPSTPNDRRGGHTPVFRIPGLALELRTAEGRMVRFTPAFLSLQQLHEAAEVAKVGARRLWLAHRRGAREVLRRKVEAVAATLAGFGGPIIGGGTATAQEVAEDEEADENGHGELPEMKQLLSEMGEGRPGGDRSATVALPPPGGLMAVLNTVAVGTIATFSMAMCRTADWWDNALVNSPFAMATLGFPEHINIRADYLETYTAELAAANRRAAGLPAGAAPGPPPSLPLPSGTATSSAADSSTAVGVGNASRPGNPQAAGNATVGASPPSCPATGQGGSASTSTPGRAASAAAAPPAAGESQGPGEGGGRPGSASRGDAPGGCGPSEGPGSRTSNSVGRGMLKARNSSLTGRGLSLAPGQARAAQPTPGGAAAAPGRSALAGGRPPPGGAGSSGTAAHAATCEATTSSRGSSSDGSMTVHTGGDKGGKPRPAVTGTVTPTQSPASASSGPTTAGAAPDLSATPAVLSGTPALPASSQLESLLGLQVLLQAAWSVMWDMKAGEGRLAAGMAAVGGAPAFSMLSSPNAAAAAKLAFSDAGEISLRFKIGVRGNRTSPQAEPPTIKLPELPDRPRRSRRARNAALQALHDARERAAAQMVEPLPFELGLHINMGKLIGDASEDTEDVLPAALAAVGTVNGNNVDSSKVSGGSTVQTGAAATTIATDLEADTVKEAVASSSKTAGGDAESMAATGMGRQSNGSSSAEDHVPCGILLIGDLGFSKGIGEMPWKAPPLGFANLAGLAQR